MTRRFALGHTWGLWPELVYLHAGTKKGCKALGVATKGGTVEMEKLPKAVRSLEPYHAENFLCIFKVVVGGAGRGLAATVMLGVASEHSFLLLLEAAESNGKYGARFASAAKERSLLQKFRTFKSALDQHVLADLPREVQEDLDIDLAGILSVIRTFRNDSGHPSGKILSREQTYVLLQMFVPYCNKIYQLIDFFK